MACLSNLRQVVQACVNYTVEYKGSYPYGFIFNKTNPTTGRPTDSGASGYITWFSACDKYMRPKETEIILLDANSGFIDGATRRVFSPAFKCPTVQADTFKQQVHYYNHGVVMPHATLEIPSGFAPRNGDRRSGESESGISRHRVVLGYAGVFGCRFRDTRDVLG